MLNKASLTPHCQNACLRHTAALMPLLTSKLFGLNVVIHFTSVNILIECAVSTHSLRLFVDLCDLDSLFSIAHSQVKCLR